MGVRRRLLLIIAIVMIAAGMPRGSAAAGPKVLPGAPAIGMSVGQITVNEMRAHEQLGPAYALPSERPHPQPGRADLPQAPGSEKLIATAQPQAPPNIGPKSPQTAGTQFQGATFNDVPQLWPPDTMGAVGPTQFVVFLNNRVRSFNKTTGVADGVLNASPDAFFSPAKNPSDFTSDPHIRYDRLSGRWFVSMITVPNTSTSTNNRVVFAVSGVNDITTWTESFFTVGAGHPNCLWDYDTLGIDSNALYVGGNLFCGTSNPLAYTQSDGLVLHKSALIAGTVAGTDFFLGNPAGTGCPNDGPFTPQGVDSYDGSPVGYFIGVSVCFFGELPVIKVTNPGGSASASAAFLTVPSTFVPEPTFGVAALGVIGTLDALDDRLFAAHLRGGHLWTAHNVKVNNAGVSNATATPAPDRAAARWYDITNVGTTPTLTQSGTVFDSSATATNYWVPSIMVSGQGHAAMGMSAASATERADDATVGRLAGDTPGTMQTPTIYQTSPVATYNPSDGSSPHRWGDYTYTSLDPNDDMTMWTIQEYISATDTWAVEAVQLKAPPPATPAAVSGGTIYTGQANKVVHIAGTSTSGSGFFDPGGGFPNRLQAAVSGGVAVNSVTYIDAAHVDLNLNTNGASPGTKSLTITNPDGQLVTANNFLTVFPGPPPPPAHWAGWYPLGGSAAGRVALGTNGDGRLEGFWHGNDGTVRHIWQNSPAGGWTQDYGIGGSPMGDPAVATNRDGRLEAFAVFNDGQLWHAWQVAPSSFWTGWYPLGGAFTGRPSVMTNRDGRMEAFIRGADNAIWHVWQNSPGGGWVMPFSLGGSTAGDPAAGTNADGHLEVFARRADNAIWHAWQVAPGAGWGSWVSLGGTLTGSPAVSINSDGRLEAFARGADNALWHTWQTSPNGIWYPFSSFGGSFSSDPAVGINADRRLEAFILDSSGEVNHNWQMSPGGLWFGFATLSGFAAASPPGIGTNTDGRLELLARGNDNTLWHAWQTVPNG